MIGIKYIVIILIIIIIIYQEKEQIIYFMKSKNGIGIPTNERCSLKVLDIIKNLPKNNYKLVDFGCGEGDMLNNIYNEKTYIKDIVGIELDNKIAHNTINRFQSYNNITVHNMDMIHYNFESNPTILYMYEPLFRMKCTDAIPIYNSVFMNLSKNKNTCYIIYVSGTKQILQPIFFKYHNYILCEHYTVDRFFGLATHNIYLYKNNF